MLFFSFHRMKVRCSAEFLDGCSAVKKAMREVSSGTTTAISDPLRPAWLNNSRTIGRAASIFRPAGNSDVSLPAIRLRCLVTPATMTSFDVSSQAHNGACGEKTSVIDSTSPLLNECNLVDFFQRCYAGKNLCQRGIAQERHAFVVGGALNFRRGPSFDDHFANVVRQIEQLVNRRSAAKA